MKTRHPDSQKMPFSLCNALASFQKYDEQNLKYYQGIGSWQTDGGGEGMSSWYLYKRFKS